MSAFAVMSIVPNEELDRAIVGAFPEAYFRLSPSNWLVAARGITTRELCEKINVKAGGISGTVVVKVDSYFGFASREIWEWLRVKTSEEPDGEAPGI